MKLLNNLSKLVVTRPRSDVTTISNPTLVNVITEVVTRPRSDVTTIYKGHI